MGQVVGSLWETSSCTLLNLQRGIERGAFLKEEHFEEPLAYNHRSLRQGQPPLASLACMGHPHLHQKLWLCVDPELYLVGSLILGLLWLLCVLLWLLCQHKNKVGTFPQTSLFHQLLLHLTRVEVQMVAVVAFAVACSELICQSRIFSSEIFPFHHGHPSLAHFLSLCPLQSSCHHLSHGHLLIPGHYLSHAHHQLPGHRLSCAHR